jgi:hypothetical protein
VVQSFALPVTPMIVPGWPMFHAEPEHDGAALAPALSLRPPPVLAGPGLGGKGGTSSATTTSTTAAS